MAYKGSNELEIFYSNKFHMKKAKEFIFIAKYNTGLYNSVCKECIYNGGRVVTELLIENGLQLNIYSLYMHDE